MGGAAEGEKAVLRWISAAAQPRDIRESRLCQPVRRITLQVEVEMVRPGACDERAAIAEMGAEFGADFVIRLGDAGADGGSDAYPFGAQCFHGGDGRFQHAAQCPFPTGMGGADHPRLW